MPLYRDQTNREIEILPKPKRIISLVPSQTELLDYLGLGDFVVGITAYCVHPKSWLKKKQVIGGTKNLNLDLIRSLDPDLVIGNKEENVKDQIDELAKDYPVWLSDVNDLTSALRMIDAIGEITDSRLVTQKLSEGIQSSFERLGKLKNIQTAYFMWHEPLMVAGNPTFINAMMEAIGLQNVFSKYERYPEIPLEQLQEADPELILLSSEPYSFKAKHLHEIAKVCPKALVKIVDGEMFSWYGSRMLKSLNYFKLLRHELDLVFH